MKSYPKLLWNEVKALWDQILNNKKIQRSLLEEIQIAEMIKTSLTVRIFSEGDKLLRINWHPTSLHGVMDYSCSDEFDKCK